MAATASEEPASHRACAHCRSQKVRCLPDDSNPDICSRCGKAGRPCVFTPLQKRKQRKRTDTRVAELEREMRGLRAVLRGKQLEEEEGKGGERPVGYGARPAGLWYQTHAQGALRVQQGVFREQGGDEEGGREGLLEQAMVQAPASQQTSMRSAQQQRTGAPSSLPERLPEASSKFGRDVIDRGLLSMATARQLVETYKTDLFPHYPTVVILASITVDELRRARPTLFLAVLAAAAGKEHSDLSATLDKEVLEAYATRSLMHSEKSLELVQALLISAIWYHPPSKFGQLKYYEYIHMAATMAMDLGIGTRPKVARSRLGNAARGREPARQAMVHPAEDASNPDLSMTPRSRDGSPDTGSLESRRTFVACYMICAGVSLSLRRPNMLRVSSYVRECVDYLDRSPDALPSDRTLVRWARLIMIAEEVSVSFSYDDPGGIASLAELRTQLMLRDFEKRLTSWWASVPLEEGHGSLTIMYYTIRLYLHEIALHVDHSPEDFRAPYQMGTIIHHPPPPAPASAADAGSGAAAAGAPEVPTQVLASAIAECITSSHALLSAFLAMDVDGLRALPVFSYVRVSFAAFVLAKLCLSASHRGSRIYRVLDRRALQVESYMDRAVLHVRNIVGGKRCRVPAIFLALLFKLRQWCLNPEMIERAAEGDVTATGGFEGLRRGGVMPDTHTETGAGARQLQAGGGSSSGSEGSPQSLSEGREQQGGSGLTPESLQASSHNVSLHFDLAEGSGEGAHPDGCLGEDPRTDGAAAISIPQSVPADWFEDMQLDSEYMQYFGDMMDTITAEGGLTGLDDWMPSDLNELGMGVGGETALPAQASAITFGYGWQNG
ncbi:hypothetical protein B0A55_03160 [Friedmanniomyces simplex]|uniref:Zn(2)-C6 fungal-type domain-containing protein n=1 Tax=Friedmanniomyces simplex TaxID=329884 RepID=A0A4U0XNQ0_9PEZI|nr:hypothetical protein B0A55_03160 [Friedmanniomyces simplex]